MKNLYGWAMSKVYYSAFNWLKNVNGLNVMSSSEKKSDRIFSRS